jgi:hypothetical protein
VFVSEEVLPMRAPLIFPALVAWLLPMPAPAAAGPAFAAAGDEGRKAQKPDEEAAAVLALEKAGSVSFQRSNGDSGPVVEVTLGPILSKATLEQLRRFQHLRAVDIDWQLATRVPQSALALLPEVPHVRRLNLAYFPIDDAGLKRLRELRVLDLRYSRITDDGLPYLGGLTGLQELTLSKTRVTSAGLASLKDMADLRLLDLHGTAVGDAGLRWLPPAKRLRWVDVSDTGVSGTPRDAWRNLRLQVRGTRARLYDADTGKPIGKELKHGFAADGQDFDITCWSFSPDGKLVVTGAGYRGQADVPLNFGDLRVWDAVTGKEVARYSQERRAIGSVRMVAFLRDGKTMIFAADAFKTDGK